ncbi:MAG: hypothetical protein M5U22_00070 [Thermoleophilia bacterium]|nr:hypothetical protein [Thermoleophilia bacterium]
MARGARYLFIESLVKLYEGTAAVSDKARSAVRASVRREVVRAHF